MLAQPAHALRPRLGSLGVALATSLGIACTEDLPPEGRANLARWPPGHYAFALDGSKRLKGTYSLGEDLVLTRVP